MKMLCKLVCCATPLQFIFFSVVWDIHGRCVDMCCFCWRRVHSPSYRISIPVTGEGPSSHCQGMYTRRAGVLVPFQRWAGDRGLPVGIAHPPDHSDWVWDDM